MTFFIAALMLQGSCTTLTDVPLSVEVSADTGSSGFAEFTVRNNTAGAVFVSRCGDHVLVAVDRRVGDAWENAAADICLAIYPMDPFRLEPGEAKRDSVHVPGPGAYRLRLVVHAETASSDAEVVTSAGFSVR